MISALADGRTILQCPYKGRPGRKAKPKARRKLTPRERELRGLFDREAYKWAGSGGSRTAAYRVTWRTCQNLT